MSDSGRGKGLEKRSLVLLNAMPNGVCVLDKNFSVVFWNTCLEDWTSWGSLQAVGRPIQDISEKLGEPSYRMRLESLFSGGPPVVFSSQLHPNLFPSAGVRVKRSYYTKVTSIELDGEYFALFAIEDVSELGERIRGYREANNKANKELEQRKAIEADLRLALEEKELLMQETHHRIKNNLQLVSAIIQFQKDEISDQGMVDVLQDLWNRIQSISLIHEKLYGSGNLVGVDFGEYTQSLVDTLMDMLMPRKLRIRPEYQIEVSGFPLETVIPLGVATVEMVTNAIKYAFSKLENGRLSISLAKEGGEWVYRVANQPNTLPPGFNVKKAKGLGMDILDMMVQQIKGQLKVYSGESATFEIRFPEPEEKGLL